MRPLICGLTHLLNTIQVGMLSPRWPFKKKKLITWFVVVFCSSFLSVVANLAIYSPWGQACIEWELCSCAAWIRTYDIVHCMTSTNAILNKFEPGKKSASSQSSYMLILKLCLENTFDHLSRHSFKAIHPAASLYCYIHLTSDHWMIECASDRSCPSKTHNQYIAG